MSAVGSVGICYIVDGTDNYGIASGYLVCMYGRSGSKVCRGGTVVGVGD